MAEVRTGPLAAAALVVGGSVLALLLVEGAASLWRFQTPWPSLTATWIARLRGLAGGAAAEGPWLQPILSDPSGLKAMVPALERDGVGLGNAPSVFQKHAQGMALNEERDGCLRQRPNLDKVTGYLRAGLWDPLRPVTAFYDADAQLGPDVRDFLERYAVRRVRLRTDAHGERRTLPAVDAVDVVLVAGDSVAQGALLADAETLASQLQLRDRSRRYVNIGVAGAHAADVACNLDEALARHHPRVRELVYVYCENDLDPREPLGEPDGMVAWMRDRFAREPIDAVTVIYAPFIYNVVPDLTRFRGYRGWKQDSHAPQRERLAALAEEAGFRWVDAGALALSLAGREGARMAALAFFQDEVHWSPRGTALVAEALLTGGAR